MLLLFNSSFDTIKVKRRSRQFLEVSQLKRHQKRACKLDFDSKTPGNSNNFQNTEEGYLEIGFELGKHLANSSNSGMLWRRKCANSGWRFSAKKSTLTLYETIWGHEFINFTLYEFNSFPLHTHTLTHHYRRIIITFMNILAEEAFAQRIPSTVLLSIHKHIGWVHERYY